MVIITIHVVKYGETLTSIGEQNNVSPYKLSEDNKISLNQNLVTGQTIFIGADENDKLGKIAVKGYAFPNISPENLDNAMKNITYLCTFSYQAQEDGSITPLQSSVFDAVQIPAACSTVLVLTNIGMGGDFSGQLSRQLFRSDDAMERLIENIDAVMTTKGYQGINIDFEYVYPQDKTDFNNFIKKIADYAHRKGYKITSSLVPETTATNQRGTYYEGHDYKFHGETSDYVCLMTYEWGYAFSPPMPVAPIEEVENVIRYAVNEIDPAKIFLGIPTYGYDWIQPYTADSSARAIGNIEAVNLARAYNVHIQFHEKYQTPYFQYHDGNNQEHIVWFGDARSFKAKAELVHKYGLKGISLWTLNRPYPQSWLVMNALYDIETGA